MAVIDKGWYYLSSRDVNIFKNDNEEDWCYSHTDGSSSFRGADGSWGYINSDGSGYFRDADGGWGSRNSDGSVSYYSADGTSKHKAADRINSFRNEEDNDDYDDYDDERSLEKSIGTIIGAGIALASVIDAKKKAEEHVLKMQRERERRERMGVRNEKIRIWLRDNKTIVLTVSFIVVGMLISFFTIYEMQKLIPMGVSSDSLKGLKYVEVVQKLKELGFSNVSTKEISDLTISRDDEENLVTDVKLLFGNSFTENKKYPSNFRIIVVYHTVELYKPPITSGNAKGMNYNEVIEKFENVGFVNVSTHIEYDIITGWLTKDGEVKSVSINGDKKYGSYDKFRLDAEVIITYHTLRTNKPK